MGTDIKFNRCASRLGILTEATKMLGSEYTSYPMDFIGHMIGNRNYELSNHLGNVLSVISDKIIPVDESGTVTFLADIRQSTDYSPFGVTLENRNLKLLDPVSGNPVIHLRYAFNGMEKDDEIKGSGNSYDFGARMLDPRLGRWLTIDPSYSKYPSHSPYEYAINSPLMFNDPNGKDAVITISEKQNKNGQTVKVINVKTDVYLVGESLSAQVMTHLNKRAGDMFKSYSYNIDGEEYEINFQVNYINATKGTVTSVPGAINTFTAGNMAGKIPTEQMTEESGKQITYRPIENVYLPDGENYQVIANWTKMENGQEVPENSSKTNNAYSRARTLVYQNPEEQAYVIIHETCHFLGFMDRYHHYIDAQGNKIHESIKGFELSVMGIFSPAKGNLGYGFVDAQLINYIKGIRDLTKNKEMKYDLGETSTHFTLFKILQGSIGQKGLDNNSQQEQPIIDTDN